MPEDFSHLSGDDKLKAENEFLKMKLMLEHGAQFGKVENNDSPLPPELENEFLTNIAAFEEQFQQRKTIKVFDKIGRPAHFKPVGDIPDNDIAAAWQELKTYLNEHSIDLDVCSPNVSVRELYRFTTEELFEHEMDDMTLPGWCTNFIYDEFYPDPVHDSTQTAMHDCLHYILSKEPMEWTHHFRKENLRLNEHYPLSAEELKTVVNRFKSAYDDLELTEVAATDCSVIGNTSTVKGRYSVTASIAKNVLVLQGNWKVTLECADEPCFWHITAIDIEGIKF